MKDKELKLEETEGDKSSSILVDNIETETSTTHQKFIFIMGLFLIRAVYLSREQKEIRDKKEI
jgi:hypothetical protein